MLCYDIRLPTVSALFFIIISPGGNKVFLYIRQNSDYHALDGKKLTFGMGDFWESPKTTPEQSEA